MKIISFITEQRVIGAILDSVQRDCTPSPAGSLHPPPLAGPAGEGVRAGRETAGKMALTARGVCRSSVARCKPMIDPERT